jgi:hypothetical protein
MNPAKTKEHEPTAVKKRTWNLVEPRQHPTHTEQAQEIAGKIRMIKGIAGVSETNSKYEQGAKCSRNYWQQITRIDSWCSPQFSCALSIKTFISEEEPKKHTTHEHSK